MRGMLNTHRKPRRSCSWRPRFIALAVVAGSIAVLGLMLTVLVSQGYEKPRPLRVLCENRNTSDIQYPPLAEPHVHFILVHAGDMQPPDHIYDCIAHTRRLSPTRTVLVVTDQRLENVQRLERDEDNVDGAVTFISSPSEFHAWRTSLSRGAKGRPGVVNLLIGSVPCSSAHVNMRRAERSGSKDILGLEDGFWFNTLARLYYVYDVVRAGGFHEVIHFEFDNLIFAEYDEIASPLRAQQVALTSVPLGRRNELANVMWISSAEAMEPLMTFMAQPHQKGKNEMHRLRSFVESRPGYVLRLPTFWTPQPTTQGSEAQFALFNAVFDAAAIGHWAGGADPMHEEIRGFCCFHNLIGPFGFAPRTHELTWKTASEARIRALPGNAVVPFVLLNHNGTSVPSSTEVVRVMNLHVHSKSLWRFTRRRPGSDFVNLQGSYVSVADGRRQMKVGTLGE